MKISSYIKRLEKIMVSKGDLEVTTYDHRRRPGYALAFSPVVWTVEQHVEEDLPNRVKAGKNVVVVAV